MSRFWSSLITALLIAFAGLAVAWHIGQYNGRNKNLCVARYWSHAGYLARSANLLSRERANLPTGTLCRSLDMILPLETRVFITDMIGPTNFQSKFGFFAFMTYYLFPREIAVSLDQPARVGVNGFTGRTTALNEEIFTNGFDVRIDVAPDTTVHPTIASKVPLAHPVDPPWFASRQDGVIAFFLPLLTALAGLELLRWLFPLLGARQSLPEKLACSFGLGMMAVAALTLAVKLCGFRAGPLVPLLTAAGAALALWHDRAAFSTGVAQAARHTLRNPVAALLLAAGLIVFVCLFRLAGLSGLIEFDAVMAWALKAKILHLSAGRELVHWFSNPRLAHAHLDYPILVPSLHATTYDALGHVNEFVTKFWPTWMLLLLLGALASLNRASRKWLNGPPFLLLALLLLPAAQYHVQMEGATMPITFFTVLGMVQCVLWFIEKDPARLGLGLTLLFGAAMTKFEGCIFLALALTGLWLLPAGRPSLKPSPGLWRALLFCLLAALPFLCLRLQIPVLQYESNWAGYALRNPGPTLASWPRVFLALASRQFLNPTLANWQADGSHLRWTGHWQGVWSLYNHTTLGLPWLCLLLSVVLWFAVPTRRKAMFWILAVVLSAMAALSGVFASFVGLRGLAGALSYLGDQDAGRYLFPMLIAWAAAIITAIYAEPLPPESQLEQPAATSRLPASTVPAGHDPHPKGPNRPKARKKR